MPTADKVIPLNEIRPLMGIDGVSCSIRLTPYTSHPHQKASIIGIICEQRYRRQDEDLSNVATTDKEDEEQRISPLGALLMASFAIAVIGVCFMAICISRCRRRRRFERRMAAARAGAVTLARPQDTPTTTSACNASRYSQVESWIISRKIQRHEESLCSSVCGGSSSETAQQRRAKYLKERTLTVDTVGMEESDEENGSSTISENQTCSNGGECPICYDELSIGDIVSWSPNPSCNHVFHHACIKEWLLQNEGCPFCRSGGRVVEESPTVPWHSSRSIHWCRP